MAAGLAISLLSLALAIRNVSFEAVKSTLLKADTRYMILALAFLGINTVGKAIRWKALMGLSGRSVPLYKSLAGVEVGQMLNYLYPFRVGELTRAYMIGGEGPGRLFILGTIGLEKLFDLLCYVFLFFLLLLFIPIPGWVSDSIYATALLLAAAVIAIFWVAFRLDTVIKQIDMTLDRTGKRFSLVARLKAAERLKNMLSSLEVLKRPKDVIYVLFWSALIWVTSVLITQMALLSLHVDLPWAAAVLVVIVLQAGITVPSIPGKVGIFQYACILALSIFGIEQALGFSFGILLHVLVMLPTVLLGLIFLVFLGLPVQWNRAIHTVETREPD